MNTYTDRFGGETVSPTLIDYVSISMTASVTLVWPFQTGAGENFAAHKIDINADNNGYVLTYPDARLVSPGQDILINNVGSHTVTIKSATGVTLGTVASGAQWFFYLTSNATEGGTWKATQFGTGTSSATAASLAGLGLVAQTTTLAQEAPYLTKNANYTLAASDRAGAFASTGGAITFSFSTAAALTNGWFVFVRNSGTGALTLDPNGAETIDGAATKVLAIGESCIVVSNGATGLLTYGYGRAITTTVSSISINLAGTGVYNLNNTELAAQIQNYTGILTGARTVRFGTSPGFWLVYNNTSGAFDVTFQVNGADPGVVVPQGSFSIIRSDGTNAVAAFTATTGTVTSVATGTDLTGGPITSTGTVSHANSGVAGGTYGDASNAVTVAVNARGHITSIVANTIAAAWGALTGVPAAIAAVGALTPAADKLAYYTGVSTAALADLTSYARTLIAAANAAAARTVLGLGTSAVADTGTSDGNVPVLAGGGKISSTILDASTKTTNAQATNSTVLANLAYVDRVAVQQVVVTQTAASTTGTTTMPTDDSIPQNTEGDEYMTCSITPKSATSKLVIEVLGMFGAAGDSVSVALFQDSAADALVATTMWCANTVAITIPLTYEVVSGSTSARTYKIRAGSNSPGTTTFNGAGSTRLFGGVAGSIIKITEIGV